MCPFHWELDCVGFSPFEIWRCDCVEMMREIDSFFPFLGIAGILARVSPEIRELSCLVLSCRCCCYCCWFSWSCCGCCCCCCLPSRYRAACATRGTRSGRHWLGDRWPTLAWPGMRAGRCANAPGFVWHRRLVCLFGLHPSLHLYLWLVPAL